MVRLDVDARRQKVDEIFAARHDIAAVDTDLGESTAEITSDAEQVVSALNGRFDFTNKELAATQDSMHMQSSLSDSFSEVAVARSDLEQNFADTEACRQRVEEVLATVRHDIAAVRIDLEESTAEITSDTDQAVKALNGLLDFTNKDLAATQESLHTQSSLSDCFKEAAVVRSDLEGNVADTEARLKDDVRQKQQGPLHWSRPSTGEELIFMRLERIAEEEDIDLEGCTDEDACEVACIYTERHVRASTLLQAIALVPRRVLSELELSRGSFREWMLREAQI